MSMTVPPAVNYQSPLVSFPTRWQNEKPTEGPRQIPCEIDWGSMGGANNCLNINIQNNAVQNFSQIVALKVDNSLSGADVQFIFTDMNDTVTIPAYESAVVPVFTGQTQFFVSAPNAQSEDITRFQILNCLPPPIAIAPSSAQDVLASAAIALTVGTTTLLASTVSGTIEGVNISASVRNPGGTWGLQFTYRDGTGTILWVAEMVGESGVSATAILAAMAPVHIRFQGGITLAITGTAPGGDGGFVTTNMPYRTP